MTKTEIAKQSLQWLYLEVPSIIAEDVKRKVLAAMEEAKKEGFKNACELLDSMFSKCSTHEYMLGDCLLAKVNLLEGEPRTNQGRGEGPVWVNHDEGLPDDPHKQYVIRYKLLPMYEVWTKAHLLEMHEAGYVFQWLKEPDKLEQSKKEQ